LIAGGYTQGNPLCASGTRFALSPSKWIRIRRGQIGAVSRDGFHQTTPMS